MGTPGPMGACAAATIATNNGGGEGDGDGSGGPVGVYDYAISDRVVVPDGALGIPNYRGASGADDAVEYGLSFDDRQEAAVVDRLESEQRAKQVAATWGWGEAREAEAPTATATATTTATATATATQSFNDFNDLFRRPTGVSEHRAMRLPHTYFVCDHANPLNIETRLTVWSQPPPSRTELGLREDSVVLACMNRGHKVDASTYDRWLMALKR